MPILVAIDDLHRIIYVGRNALDERNLILNSHGVSHHQRLGVMCPSSDAIHRSSSRLNPHKVVAQIVQLLLDARLSCFSDRNNTNDRGDPDGNSQYRQDAAHLVSEQRHQGGSKERRVVQFLTSLRCLILGIST